MFFENLDEDCSKNLIKSLIMLGTKLKSDNNQLGNCKLNASASVKSIKGGNELELAKQKLKEKEDELQKTKQELRRIKDCVEIGKSLIC